MPTHSPIVNLYDSHAEFPCETSSIPCGGIKGALLESYIRHRRFQICMVHGRRHSVLRCIVCVNRSNHDSHKREHIATACGPGEPWQVQHSHGSQISVPRAHNFVCGGAGASLHITCVELVSQRCRTTHSIQCAAPFSLVGFILVQICRGSTELHAFYARRWSNT